MAIFAEGALVPEKDRESGDDGWCDGGLTVGWVAALSVAVSGGKAGFSGM